MKSPDWLLIITWIRSLLPTLTSRTNSMGSINNRAIHQSLSPNMMELNHSLPTPVYGSVDPPWPSQHSAPCSVKSPGAPEPLTIELLSNSPSNCCWLLQVLRYRLGEDKAGLIMVNQKCSHWLIMVNSQWTNEHWLKIIDQNYCNNNYCTILLTKIGKNTA